MKPKLSKSQRKALIFAHDLMSGRIDTNYLPYVRGSAVRLTNGTTWRYQRHWIEPDHDPRRWFLSEDIFMSLVMLGYMETRSIPPDQIWIYRITRDGCNAIGRTYPLYPASVMTLVRDRLVARRNQELQERETLMRRRASTYGRRGDMRARMQGHSRSPFNYQTRRR